MVVENRTLEAPPSSPPRDLTIVQSEDNPAIINLSWQPPRAPNGQIDGTGPRLLRLRLGPLTLTRPGPG